jgi:hypothetical protein
VAAEFMTTSMDMKEEEEEEEGHSGVTKEGKEATTLIQDMATKTITDTDDETIGSHGD